jgi:hypothetical protein
MGQPQARGFDREGRDIADRVYVSAPHQRFERSRECAMIDVEYDLTTIRLIDRHFLEFCSRRIVRISSSGLATGTTRMAAFPFGIGLT